MPRRTTDTNGTSRRSLKAATRMDVGEFARKFALVVDAVTTVIKGKDDVVRMALTALLAEGHILFEDVPGTGKTMLARSLARCLDARAGRIQCTPDLLPGDITGSPILDRNTGAFVFQPGPVFSNVFLCDEINRATPKTQSALLEAMQERTVTVDGITHPLPTPFFVLATQNPIELAGTFPLPEAQLDRFLFKLSLGYPDRDAEATVLKANSRREPIEALQPVLNVDELLAMVEWATEVTTAEAMTLYIVDLVQATRKDDSLQLGASSRASLALQRAARVLAASQGRDDVLPDDVKKAIVPVLAHRLILSPEAELRGETVDHVIERVIARVPVPLSAVGAASAAKAR